MILLIVFFYAISSNGNFLDLRSIDSILTRAPEYGIVAIGVTFLTIAQEFDISVGSVFTFCALIASVLRVSLQLSSLSCLIIVLILGFILGTINGLITLKLRIPSIITTLGTMYAWRGLALIISQGMPVYYREKTPFAGLLTSNIFRVIPTGILWFLGIALIFDIILKYHKFGNSIRATGGSVIAAKAMGINTDRVKILCFAILGLLVALASFLESTRIGEGSARLGNGYEFYAIAAVVIGGTPITGGFGTVFGTFFAALMLEIIRTGLGIVGIPGWWFSVLVGLTIVVAMVINNFIKRRVV